MRYLGLTLAVLTAMAPLRVAAAEAPSAKPGLEAYGQLPTVDHVEISPDGASIAMVVGDVKRRQIQIRSTVDHKLSFASEIGAAKVRNLQWAGPRHLVIMSSVTAEAQGVLGPKQEYYEVFDLNLDHPKLHPLLANMDRSLNTVASTPVAVQLKDRPTLFLEGTYFPDTEGVLALYRVDLLSGNTERVQDGNQATTQFLVDAHGAIVARADYLQRSGQWRLFVNRNGGGWKLAYSQVAPLDHPDIVGLGHDGQSILISVFDGDDWQIREIGLNGESLPTPFADMADADAISDPQTRTVIGAAKSNVYGSQYHFMSPADQAAWNGVAKAFPNEHVELASWSHDRQQIVVRVEGERDGVGYFVVDMNRHAEWLTDAYADIAPQAVAERKLITYRAADGMEIPAFLTLPKDRPAKTLPMVVLVHGGPASSDDPGFDWWSQALASRGYAVLQPQYRGSTGLGLEHLNAGFGEWGRKMQTDLSDGVRDLVRQGVADPARVCIVGASYGGYAALAGAVFDPRPYRCAVSLAGPSDLRQMLIYERQLNQGAQNETVRYWDRFMGAKSPDDQALDAISPALHADRAAIPILLIHGKDDTVVEYRQSTEMATALQRAGKPVEMVTLKGEDHWLSRSETRLQMLQATVAYLEAHNPPDQAPPPGPVTTTAAAAAPGTVAH